MPAPTALILMKIGTLLGLAFAVSAAVGFSYCAGYAHGHRVAARSAAQVTAAESTTVAQAITPQTEPAPQPKVEPAKSATGGPVIAGMSRETILQMLPGKTWYSHWEIKDRARPTQFRILDNGQIQFGTSENNLNLELRWVLNQGGHLYVPIDQRTIHGFYIPTGRQKGFFADK